MTDHHTPTDEIISSLTDGDYDCFSAAANIAAKDIATCPESHRILRTAHWSVVFTQFVQDRIDDHFDPEPEEWTADTVITTPSGVPIVLSRHVNKGENLGADHE